MHVHTFLPAKDKILTSSGVLSGSRRPPDDASFDVEEVILTSMGASLKTPGALAVIASCRKAVSSKSLPGPLGTCW